MSAVQAMPSAASGTQIKPGQVLVVGRCQLVRKTGQMFAHLVVMPAPDPYSSPSTVEILSTKRVANKEEDCRILCRLGGYKRNYRATDKDTGEQTQVLTADIKLFAVED